MKTNDTTISELEEEIKSIQFTINWQSKHQSPKPYPYHELSLAYIKLDKLKGTKENREEIIKNCKSAIEFDTTNNPTFKAFLMQYYAQEGNAQEAITVAEELVAQSPASKGILDLSAQQSLNEVLRIKEVWAEAQGSKVMQNFLNFISPYVMKVAEHDIKITQAETKISEHEKRFAEDESKFSELISDLNQKLPSLVTKAELENFKQSLDQLKSSIDNNPEIQLSSEVSVIEKALEAISPKLLPYAKSLYQVVQNAAATTKVHDSHLVDMTPYAKPIDAAMHKTGGFVSSAVTVAPIVGPAVSTAIVGASAVRDEFTNQRFDKRMDNMSSAVSVQHPTRGNNELYLEVLKGTQSKSGIILKRIEVCEDHEGKLHTLLDPKSDDAKAYKKAYKKAADTKHLKDAQGSMTGLMDGYKLTSDLLKHPKDQPNIYNEIKTFFDSVYIPQKGAATDLKAPHKHPGMHLSPAGMFSKLKQKITGDKVTKVESPQKSTEAVHSQLGANTDTEKSKPVQDTATKQLSLDMHHLTLDDTHHHTTDLAGQGAIEHHDSV